LDEAQSSEEALEVARQLLTGSPTGASDGATYVYKVPSNKEIAFALDRFAVARAREERERIAQWHEAQKPQLFGPDYGLASLDERAAMREAAAFHQDCANAIRKGEAHDR
jgi:hypothetical protein